jgi:hypothetical protein
MRKAVIHALIRDMAVEQRIIRIVPALHLDYRFVTITLRQTRVVPPHHLL